jgi:hypothetical protein
MVEEIRTYLLNDKKFGEVVFLDKNYFPKKLNKTSSEFRNAIIGDNINDLSYTAWKTNLLVDGIYNDSELSSIAKKNFDSRRIPDKNLYTKDFSVSFSQNFFSSKIIIIKNQNNSPSDGIYEKKIILTKASNNKLNVSYIKNKKNYINDKELTFTFSNGMSNILDIPSSPIKIGFSGTSSIPLDQQLIIDIKYPYFLDINSIIDKIEQIPGVENLIWLNKKSYAEIFDIYTKTEKPHKKVLCLILAYAISLKQT